MTRTLRAHRKVGVDGDGGDAEVVAQDPPDPEHDVREAVYTERGAHQLRHASPDGEAQCARIGGQIANLFLT